MKFVSIAIALTLCTPAFPRYTLWYDNHYDQGDASLDGVVCSTGEYGLATYGFLTFKDLPSFPFIGGAPQIQSWDSPNCGTCWNLSYTGHFGVATWLNFLAINNGVEGGFTISYAALNGLTDGNALTLNGILIDATQLEISDCGLQPTKRV